MSFRSSLASLAALALVGGSTGCGEFIDQIQSEEVAIAMLLQTPDTSNPLTEEVIPGLTTFTLFFGSLDRSKLLGNEAEEGAFQGNAGAKVTLEYKDSRGQTIAINPQDKGGGQYAIDSSDSQLSYNNTLYTLKISWQEKLYKLEVTPPVATEMVEFKEVPSKIIVDHPAGTPLTVTRALGQDDPAKNPLAFVHVNALSGSEQTETFSNVPTDALGFLRLVLADSEWRAKQFTIPGESFVADSQYLVTLSSLERGSSLGSSAGAAALFPGSSFLAGVADAGAVMTAAAE